jgi:hypothetical protein
MNCDSRLWPQHREQTLKVVRRERYASRRWRSVEPCHMHEDRAASTCYSGAGVVVDLDDKIVEVVVPPQAVAAFARRASKRAVVTAVGGIFAPGKAGDDAARGQQCSRVGMAIGSPPQADKPKPPARGRAVALEFVGADAPSAEHDRQRERPGEQDAPRPAARSSSHTDQGKGAAAHATSLRLRTAKLSSK